MTLMFELKSALLSAAPAFVRRRVVAKRFAHEVETTGEAEMPWLRKFLARGDLALDIGCNLGVYAFELSRLTGNVIAFEPNPKLAAFVARLKLPGVEMRNLALSDRAGWAELIIPRFRSGHVLGSLNPEVVMTAGEDVDRVEVTCAVLDRIALDKVSFIKIDVEGHEESVLAGSWETIRRDRPILLIEIEERHNKGALSRIRDAFEALGYVTSFLRGGTWRDFADFDAAEDQDVGHLEPGRYRERRDIPYINNFLFVPAERAALLKTA